MPNMIFPMSDNWWIEKDKAYFCGARISVLFCMDMNSLQCEVVSRIPKCDIYDFRAHPYCLKYQDNIICLPGTGKDIWLYDIKKNVWEKIEIGHEEQLIISMSSYRRNESKIWLLEYDSGKIFQVDLRKRTVDKEYNISSDDKKIYYGGYVVVQNKLYAAAENKVSCINIDNKEITIYEIPDLKAELYTICYDGFNFWLSGYCKEIYIWNPEQGIVKVITEFPKQFGFYHFHETPYIDCTSFFCPEDSSFFEYSFLLGKYMWYIPNKSNGIIYIDKETYKVSFLEIEEEKETKDSLEREYANKFLFEYIREDRYIGLYSIKNKLLFEIDSAELCVQYREYKLSRDAVLTLAKAIGLYDDQRIFQEKREKDQQMFSVLLKTSNEVIGNSLRNIGQLIYCTLDD